MKKYKFCFIIAFLLIFLLQYQVFSKEAENKNMDKKLTRIEACKKNFTELFKGEALQKTGSDPEFMAILQKNIFGEVFEIGNLDNKTREMLTVTSLASMQTLPQLKAHINAALNTGVTPVEIRECIYQCAPFIGYPKTLNAIGVLNEVLNERGIKTPLEDTTTVIEENRFEKGFEIQNPIYGDEIKTLLSRLPDNMGDEAARLLTEVCFGDFYTRKGLDLKTRELLTISILTSIGKFDTLKSHIKGNIKIGNTKETITAAIIQVTPYTGFPNGITALKTALEVFND